MNTRFSGRQILAELSRDLSTALAHKPALITNFTTEPPPAEVELLVHSQQHTAETDANASAASSQSAASVQENVLPKTTSGIIESTPERPQYKKKKLPLSEALAANFRCELCTPRLYAVNKYLRTGNLPVLVLYYNAAFKAGPLQRDRSAAHVLGGLKEDELWQRLVQKLGFAVNDLYYQEYLACHFNASRSSETDWQQRAANCRGHVQATVHKYNIQQIILCGNAAIAMLGGEQAAKHAQQAQVFEVALTDQQKLPCVVLRSPAALLALERQRQMAADAANYQRLLAQEKEIKNNILSALRSLLASYNV